MGLDFFRRAVALQQKYLTPGRVASNSLQTNGILLDDRWCEFLRENRFLVGLSLDGPRELHDAYRVDSHQRGSFDRVMQAVECLRKHEVSFNAIVCVHRGNGDHPMRVYRFLRDCGIRFIQFIPVMQPVDAAAGEEIRPSNSFEALVTPESVLPGQFGRFLTTIFDEWARHDVGRIQVGDFEQALMTWYGMGPVICVYKDICGRAPILEHNGDLYRCDHFVAPHHRLGNIHESTIIDMANSASQEQFGYAKTTSLPSSCRDCEVRFACNGGCPKDRILRDSLGEPGLNYLCEGYRTFFRHVAPVMQAMADTLRAGRSLALVMHQLWARGLGLLPKT